MISYLQFGSLHHYVSNSFNCSHNNYYYPARTCASKGLCDRSWRLYIIITPRAHARARGYVIGRGVYILYIIYYYISAKLFFYLSKYSLSDAHFNTGRLLFEFNRLLYTLAAPEVFVSSANPVSLPSGYRVSIVRNTNIDQIETTPLRYCMLHAVEHAYLARYRQHSRIDLSVYRSTSEEKHGRLLKRGSGVSVTYDF